MGGMLVEAAVVRGEPGRGVEPAQPGSRNWCRKPC